MQPSTDPLKVLHLTDSHLFAHADGELRGRVTAATLRQVLDHYRGSGWAADLVQATGDLVQDDSSEAYVRFRDLLAPLGLPVYCVPGNHDIRSVMSELLEAEPFRYCGSATSNNWLIAGIDSCIEGNPAGRVDEAELERLRQLIDTTDAGHVMVCLHHHPLTLGSTWLDELGLQNSEQFLEVIGASGKVKVVLFGHAHQEFEGSFGPVRILGTPSTCRQFAIGSESFEVDDNPPAYRRVELYADGRVRTELVWI